ncbi:hypothetical protein N658DRAFT_433193 [Parathielavia hyrcaniae]|uniref:Rho-GAP domain-containing protein n=1 Tax=Parathielavia hyrcaniae TaxID=113614 RepID=A0AAN6SYW7_9PEZI|nr:hypothetical protein N658DRAFT_433193 [Parathielavia hyrcaniae]
MSGILNHGSGVHLTAARTFWGGVEQQGNNRDITCINSRSDTSGETPHQKPGLKYRQGYIHAQIDFADEEHMPIVDDIDADSVVDLDASDYLDGRSGTGPQFQQLGPGHTTESPPTQKPIMPPLTSPQPQMSCRISQFPFPQPCEVPELLPDQEDMSARATSPPISGPATPSAASEVFRPLTLVFSSHFDLGPMINPAFELESRDRSRKMSAKSADTGVPDGLAMIEEDDDGVNTDGVSLLTTTEESSFGNEMGEGGSGPARADKQGLLAVHGTKHKRSVSSLGSGSVASGEWRPSTARRSVSFLGRKRNGGRGEEECLERRSLTPAQLTAPIWRRGASVDGLPVPEAASLSSPSHSSQAAATSTTTRFFHRMPWFGDPQSKPEAVFGVDLKESLRVAPMKIRISHKGRSTSYRTFPLSVYKCCEFIRRAGGTDPNIFASPGNAYNVASLKNVFSLAPSYGEHFQFEGSDYTIHDAARLILIFLEELPKPLISPSVVRSWILLARQGGAIEPPCPRVETGLDFWTEALNRLPTHSRNLTKHLLTLFAEVLLAATGRIAGEDARQLASAVSRALFHQDADGGGDASNSKGSRDRKKKSAKRSVQPTLALAFLIQKRGEYAVLLGEAATTSAFRRDSKFLPSTREMLEWKAAGNK